MPGSTFFDETRQQSVVKSAIVSKYLFAWANVIMLSAQRHSGRIAYADLFAGPGRYLDGTASTPLLVLERVIQNPRMRKMLLTFFNDKDEGNCRALREAIAELPGVDSLKYPPDVRNYEVGEDVVRVFEKTHLVPTLFFVDPWGYRGLSLGLVNSVLKDWGCDCIFFFNYNRINMGLNNPLVEEHMAALFGDSRSAELRTRLSGLEPEQRELTIVEALSEALQGLGSRYVLPFRFRSSQGTRTSHHLFFVSKHVKGYEIMKEIMAGESSAEHQGVPSFEYSPADRSQPLLFEFCRPLDELGDMLLHEYAGQTLTMQELYMQHNIGRPYIKKNYKAVLVRLELEGKIKANPPAGDRQQRGGLPTCADHVEIAFPPGR